MRKLKPQEIIKAVPDVQTVVLPQDWFNNLNPYYPVFNYLYNWMLENALVPPDNKDSIFDRTYVGEKLHKQLIIAEKNRIKNQYKYRGNELEEALAWSYLNSGPMTTVGGLKISGDGIFVIPESSCASLHELSRRIYKKNYSAKIEKIRSQVAGSNFRQWLLPQIERPDRVGDIARDVKDDTDFPQDINHYEELENYLHLQGFCKSLIDSGKEAWIEYIQQYPERVKSCALCDECGTSIDVDKAFAVWNPHFGLMVLDTYCLDNLNNDFDGVPSWKLRDVNKVDVINFLEANMKCFDKRKMYVLWQWEMLEEKLKLWGIGLPVEKSGCVYFIQSQRTHTIKIGYTAGQVQNRLKDLQTAHPYQLNVLATLPGDQNYEKSLHQRFAEYRLKGEWFGSSGFTVKDV